MKADIIRDSKGLVVAAWVNKVPSPMILEAKAMMDGLKLARSCNLQKIQIKGDTKIIMDTIRKNNLGPSYLYMLIKDIRDMSRHFIDCSFEWTPREGSQTTIILFSFNEFLDCHRQWFYSWPDCIKDVLFLDFSRQ